MDSNQNAPQVNEMLDILAGLGKSLTPQHVEMLRTVFSIEAQAYFQVVEDVAGFEMNTDLKEPFLKFHKYVTDPQPDWITRLRDNEKKDDYWYCQLVNGVLGNVQQSFLCVLYHQSRLLEVETELMSRLASLGELAAISKNSTLGIGGTQILDFEYQAYIMAYRRCLDQFSTALSAFFKERISSFRKLPKSLARKRPPEIVRAITDIHCKYVSAFEFVMSEGSKSSVRDRIAHSEFVQAGTLNIRVDGAVIIGGGEGLNINRRSDADKVELSKKIINKTLDLHRCIAEMLDEFIKSVSAWELETKD